MPSADPTDSIHPPPSSSANPTPPPPPPAPSTSFYYSNGQGEEISTIFVVGFPDDMQEREFQNMFIFSPGFEAATLKVPKELDEDPLGARKQTVNFGTWRDMMWWYL